MPPINSKIRKNGTEYENVITSKNTALDFEKYIQENKTLLLNDPLREILLYPSDDVSSVVLPRRWRTVTTVVPDVRTAASCPLLTRQALLSYASSWNLVHYKYSSYSGSYINLPRSIDNKIPLEVYDIDTETDNENEAQTSKVDVGTKEGYLLKGPEIGSDRIFSNLASKSFKKRFCSIVKEADGTYILEVYKDEKKTETKLTVVMDFCSEVIRNPKRGRFCFELRMAAGKGYTFSTENEEELLEWMNVLTAALRKNQETTGNNQTDELVDKDVSLTAEPPPPTYGTLKGLEHSMNPLLMRYSRETDMSIAVARNECRANIFTLPYKRSSSPEPQLEPFKEHFGQRIMLKCDSLKFRLQAPIDGDRELLCQVEPYFMNLAVYDSRSGKKLTENFHFDLNHNAVKDLVKDNECTKSLVENFSYDVKLDIDQIPEEWFKSKKQVILSINNPHPDLFIVVRIDKILQGHVNQVSEPYLKATKDPRLGLKVHKSIQCYANRVGAYKMPFAWAAKPLFRMYSNDLDTTPDFPAIYRQEPNKMSDDDLIKILSDFRKPEKLAKLTVIPGWLNINIQQSNEQIPNCMTSAYAALKPFPIPPTSPLTLELATLSVEPEQPYAAYVHHLYVRPLCLNFESQKMFARARNIACTVELKESDTADPKPLQNTGPDIIWVEGEKQLLRCQLVLDSTVATRDVHLHNLFNHAEKLIQASSPPMSPSLTPWNEFCNVLKAAHAIHLTSLIGFLPTILNQLFEMMMSRNERFHADLLDNIDKLVTTVEPSYILQQPMQTHIFNKNLALFLKSCLSFMDRGFVFRQVKKYVEKFKPCDPKALFDFKFTFLQIICSHEHFIAFNLPLQANILAKESTEDTAKLRLTETFIMRHFLAGILLQQVEQSLREAPQKRRVALGVLRALFVKHEHDDRYATRQCRARVAQLYAPWLTIVIENSHRLVTKSLASPIIENGHDNVDGDATVNPTTTSQKEVASASSTPRRNRLTLHFDHTPIRNSTHFKDPPVIQTNMYVKDQQNISQTSLESVSTMSGGDSLPRNTKLDLSEIGDQVNRFGVMSAEEVRDVLLCFLFVLKYMDEDRLVEWWKTHVPAQQQAFFNVLEICAEQFQYVGRKKILSDLKTSTPDCSGKSKPIKARTLPARMSPPDFSKEPPIIVEKNNSVNRENLVAASVISELDAMADHAVLSAGSLATEVGLTIIDRLCLFMKYLGAAEGMAAKPYLKLLQYPQSESLYKHLFAALRAYINQFSETLFEGGSSLCAGVVTAVVRLCETRAAWLRREAAAALYLLMRANFQHGTGGNLTRVHLQPAFSIVVEFFASSNHRGLSTEVAELMKRVRTVVGARSRLAGVGDVGISGAGSLHLAELQHALAASCRATPRLRHAWLSTLAEHHTRHSDHDEAMCCQLHIAALIAEYLKLRGTQSWGADVFAEISMNIPRDETGLKIDEGM
ncbi:Dedicator of cytokinesis protein 9 [Eumeta japonica]|uniref:Dedicator of cytokinesis protein 9 n=1 Tax=Eumeta variegata TaxID=151549 RepID=A0A4C1X7I6_EUMVA|nr:Dedicator of cytokinesis protein 9 [Eumeta japonica]